MSNQPFSLYNECLNSARSKRIRAHAQLAWAKEDKAKADFVRAYNHFEQFHSIISSAISDIQYARLCRQDKLKWL